MPFDSRYEKTCNLVVHVGHGLITYADIQAELKQWVGEGWTRHSLWDLRDASLSLLTGAEVRTLASQAVAYARKFSGYKNAWVAVEAGDFGLCRMSEMLADGAGLDLAVFYNYDEALRWIAS